jgi:nucleoid-associated protein YgaU
MNMTARVGIVISVVAIGVAAALPFRKDGTPTANSSQHDASPIERRIYPGNGDAWKGTFPSSNLSTQPLRLPTAATGMDTTVRTETPDFPPSYHRTHSPVGALLNRPDEPLDDSFASAEPMLLEPELSDPNARPLNHKISDGDTLAALAKQYLHDATRWPELFEHNRDVLKSADLLPIGCVIKIPTGNPPKPAAEPRVEAAGSMSPIPRGAFRRD